MRQAGLQGLNEVCTQLYTKPCAGNRLNGFAVSVPVQQPAVQTNTKQLAVCKDVAYVTAGFKRNIQVLLWVGVQAYFGIEQGHAGVFALLHFDIHVLPGSQARKNIISPEILSLRKEGARS